MKAFACFFLIAAAFIPLEAASICVAPDNGSGTATLPPAGCQYVTRIPLLIENGLSPAGTINIDATFGSFTGVVEAPGGSLGGDQQSFTTLMTWSLTGTGPFAGYNRVIQWSSQVAQTHTAPRTPGDPVQSFDALLFEFFASRANPAAGDPDFDLLRITAGPNFGLPGSGHTILTQSGANWEVDSFFDITYRIDFVGATGGNFAGMSGSTTGESRIEIEAIPEPGTVVLLLTGLTVLVLVHRRRKALRNRG